MTNCDDDFQPFYLVVQQMKIYYVVRIDTGATSTSYAVFMPKLSTHRMHDPGSIVPDIRLKVLTYNQM
jgi:hypothetical protein